MRVCTRREPPRSHLQSAIGALYDLQAQGGLYTVPAAPRPPATSTARS